jgi:hypothetical protein
LPPRWARQDLIDGHGLVAVVAQPFELGGQQVGAHRQIALIGVMVLDVVVGQGQDVIARPGPVDVGRGPLGRRNESRNVACAAGQQQQAARQQEQARIQAQDGQEHGVFPP